MSRSDASDCTVSHSAVTRPAVSRPESTVSELRSRRLSVMVEMCDMLGGISTAEMARLHGIKSIDVHRLQALIIERFKSTDFTLLKINKYSSDVIN